MFFRSSSLRNTTSDERLTDQVGGPIVLEHRMNSPSQNEQFAFLGRREHATEMAIACNVNTSLNESHMLRYASVPGNVCPGGAPGVRVPPGGGSRQNFDVSSAQAQEAQLLYRSVSSIQESDADIAEGHAAVAAVGTEESVRREQQQQNRRGSNEHHQF